MTEPALVQLRRILSLIPELSDGRPHSIRQAARAVGADRETLFHDLMALAERYDDPGGFVQGVQVYIEAEQVEVVSPHFLRPMRLTPSELAALELGLGLLAGERPEEEQGGIARARMRLRQAITRLAEAGNGAELRVASTGSQASPALLATLRKAIQARRKLRLTYHAGSATAETRRTARPYGLVYSGGMWYLVAHCERGVGLRIFRLDRIVEAEPLASGFDPPEGEELEEVLARGRAFRGDPPETLTVWYSPRVAPWHVERSGKPPSSDGSIILEYPLADLDWAVRHVLQYGPEAEVIGPWRVRDEVRRRLAAMQE